MLDHSPEITLLCNHTHCIFVHLAVLHVRSWGRGEELPTAEAVMCLVFPEAYSLESNHLKYVLQIAFLMEYM